MQNYQEKFQHAIKNTHFNSLSKEEQTFLKQQALKYRFSFQEIKQLIDFGIDFHMWNEGSLQEALSGEFDNKKAAFNHVRARYLTCKNSPHSYEGFSVNEHKAEKFSFYEKKEEKLALGMCPVASESTRCCNLLTLDAVESCGFDCSYCSIQSFYNQNRVGIDVNLANKLQNLKLDPNSTYHIGTGQSSDSLMWGNRGGILDALFDFASNNPNVILEFKTKSDYVTYFLEHETPRNIIVTYSLNTPTIIENEEHLTATLDERIAAARTLANRGIKVGFHFHPIVVYEGYLTEYKKVYDTLLERFEKSEVALVSFGTLTFIKPVIQKLRERNFKSKILQMPMEDASGKQSYPLHVKEQMFSHAYESFSPWHSGESDDVFFYLCMEEHSLWRKCFGYEYASNNHFEEQMLASYRKKTTS